MNKKINFFNNAQEEFVLNHPLWTSMLIFYGMIIHWAFFSFFWLLNYQFGWLWCIYLGSMAFWLFSLFILSINFNNRLEPLLNSRLETVLSVLVSFFLTQALILGFMITSGILPPNEYPSYSLKFNNQIITLFFEIPIALLASYQFWFQANKIAGNQLFNFIFIVIALIISNVILFIILRYLWQKILIKTKVNQSSSYQQSFIKLFSLFMVFFSFILRLNPFPVHQEGFIIGWGIIVVMLSLAIRELKEYQNTDLEHIYLFLSILTWLFIQSLVNENFLLWELVYSIYRFISIPITYIHHFILITLDVILLAGLWYGSKKLNPSANYIKLWHIIILIIGLFSILFFEINKF
ncbi:MAG: hypothetical protein ACXAC7_20655 [Candidatus Hodarchaeales archaeon]|jgi:hypothetical protein